MKNFDFGGGKPQGKSEGGKGRSYRFQFGDAQEDDEGQDSAE